MKTMSKNFLIGALVLSAPLLQNCGKARYQQIGNPAPQAAQAQIPPAREPMGPMAVRPAPRPTPRPAAGDRTAPPLNESGEQPIVTIPVSLPVQPETNGPRVDWMDPSHSNPANPPVSLPQPAVPQAPTEVQPPVGSQPQPASTPCPSWEECFVGEYTQPSGMVTDKVDLVFVVDTSESIFKERLAAASGIDRFMSALPSDIDYRIGVIAGHGETTGYAGEMVRIGSEPTVLNSKEHSRDDIRAALRAKLIGVPQDNESDGGELGLYSLNRAITGEKLAKNRAIGMFRRDAGLVVVFLSDENDICSLGDYPNAKPDPNGKELPAFKKYCEGKVSAGSVYLNLVQLKADADGTLVDQLDQRTISKPLLLAAITYTDEKTVPTEGESDRWAMENEVGYGYLDIVRMNNGIAVDLAQGDIPGALSRIAEATRSKLSIKTEFMIHESRVIDPESICVFVDGEEVAHTFDQERKQVNLPAGGAAGSRVEIYYCAQKTLPPIDGTYESVEDLLDVIQARENGRRSQGRLLNPHCVTVRKGQTSP